MQPRSALKHCTDPDLLPRSGLWYQERYVTHLPWREDPRAAKFNTRRPRPRIQGSAVVEKLPGKPQRLGKPSLGIQSHRGIVVTRADTR